MTDNRRPARLLALLVLLLVPAGLSGQDSDERWLERCDDHDDGREVVCEIRPVAVGTTGSLAIESSNGVIDLRGGTQSEVRLRARVRGWGDDVAEARENLRAVRIVVDGGEVRADGPSTRDGEGWTVDFIGTVPQRYDLEVDTRNGPVTVENVRGRLDVESANGPVHLGEVSGQVRAHTSNGPLTLELTDARVVDGGLDLQTSNGPLTLVLPRGVGARLEAGTRNGPISTDFDVPIRRTDRHSPAGEIDATLGAGGGTIRARTSNGPLTVRAN